MLLIRIQIRIYEPVSLIVGTRGRNLSGVHGLLPGSISKYCLQHSPIPVIVVRPSPKREKKKNKRLADPNRRSYNHIRELSERQGGARLLSADSSANSSVSRLPDEEAAVAEALGLPAYYSSSHSPSMTTDMISDERSSTDDGDTPQSAMWNSLDEAVKEAHAAGEFESDADTGDNESIASVTPSRSPLPEDKLTPVSTNESESTLGPDDPTDNKPSEKQSESNVESAVDEPPHLQRVETETPGDSSHHQDTSKDEDVKKDG